MSCPFITSNLVEDHLTWPAVVNALKAGHKLPTADIGDVLNRRGAEALLTRAAWIDGLGMGVKSMSIFPENRDQPTINGAMMIFDDTNGTVKAVIDGALVTKWKTAGDSVLGARLLARTGAKRLLIIGAGTVAGHLIDAYRAVFGALDVTIWNRTHKRAADLAAQKGAAVADDLEGAVGAADIIACATMSTEPVLRGAWLKPGQHVDLIGAYRPDMREADDAALQRAALFVDSRATTIGHIGELDIPLGTGAISASDLRGDLYDIVAGRAGRKSDDEITLFKNGGGAHLDLMTAGVILEVWQAGQGR